MQTELTFPGTGPMIEGSWYNPKTGDSFTVRDSFMEDNNFIVVTTDGRRVDARIMQDYIQSDEKTINNLKKMKKENKPQEQPKVNNSILGDLGEYADDFDDPINQPFGVHGGQDTIVTQPQKKEMSETDIHKTIIDKALAGLPKPSVKLKIEFDGDIKTPIEFLQNIMGVKKEEIASAMCETYMDTFVEQIKEQISQKL